MSIKITLVSGGRADWGLLSPVCATIKNDSAFELRIVATGQHLMNDGATLETIKNDGFDIGAAINMGLGANDSAADITRAMGKALEGFASEFETSRPDCLIILGDRYEILASVQAALVTKIPVAHICGGDVTEGAMDDAIRHAITKMAHIHFATNEDAALRLAQMGEEPENIHTVGSPGLDHIHTLETMSRDEFFASIDFTPLDKNILVTFHPVTLESASQVQCQEMLSALAKLENTGLIFTGSNADPEGQQITALVKNFATKHENVVFHESLGTKRYFSALKHADAMLGNSSSGLYEAPSFNLPAINIGNRQKGRLKASSVIDCAPNEAAITAAIEKALSSPRPNNTQNPYGDGKTAKRIVEILKQTRFDETLVQKHFVDTWKKS